MNAVTDLKPSALAEPMRHRQLDLSPQTFEQAMWLAESLANSDLVPRHYRGKPGDCFIAMQWGQELGLKTLQAIQNIAPINGKPSIYGDLGKAILLAAGCIIDEDDSEIVRQKQRARCKITRPGRPPVERTFSVDDAKQAGLWGKEGPWKTYPQRQLAWRAFWFAARDAAADLLRGISGAEEAMDYAPPPTGGPTPIVERVDPPAPATWPADAFANQLERWTKAVQAGLKSVDDILAMARSKGALTDEQEKAIRAIAPAAPPAADPPAAAAPTFGDDTAEDRQ